MLVPIKRTMFDDLVINCTDYPSFHLTRKLSSRKPHLTLGSVFGR